MKKGILIFIIFLTPLALYSQKGEGDNLSLKRGQWLIGQRMFPFSQIPANGLNNAYKHRDSLRIHNGFYVQHSINSSVGENNSVGENVPGWSSLGPTPGNYGSQMISGRCSFVKYDPVNPNIIYLGAACGGLWKSIDNGTTWMALTDTLRSLSSGAIAIDDVNNIIYYGTGEFDYFQYVYYGNGLYKSNDGGLSFHQAGSGLPFPCYIASIAIKPNERNVLLAAVGSNYANVSFGSGLYRSTDYGESWKRLIPTTAGTGLVCSDVAFSPDGSKAYIVGPQDGHPNIWDNGVGFRFSLDGGLNWISADNRVKINTRGRISVCNADNGNRIYIITAFVDSICGNSFSRLWVNVFRSDDAGNTFNIVWQKLACPCPNLPNAGCDRYNYQPEYNLFIKVHPDNPDMVYWGTSSIWKSTDGGANSDFVAGYGTNVHPDFHDLDFYPNDQNRIIAVSDGGVYSSADRGLTWSDLNSTLTITQFYRLSADPGNLDNILAGTQDNSLQRKDPNFSHVWRSDLVAGGDVGTVSFNPINSHYALVKDCNDESLYYSTNNGVSFSYSTSVITTWLMPVVWHPTMENIVFIGGRMSDEALGGMIKSVDHGQTWNRVQSDFPPNNTMEQLAISSSNPSIMFASIGSYSFWIWAWSYQALYKTTNGGTNWENLQIMEDVNPKISKRYISRIAVNPLNENDIFIVLSGFGIGHVWRSTDGGTNWRDVSGNLADVPVNDIKIFNDSKSGLPNCVIATDCGVFISFEPRSWIEVGIGLPNSSALDLDLKLNSSALRVATHGRGIWEINLAAARPNSPKKEQQLKRFYLYQNTPNPFNPVTKIKYEIPYDVNVTIKIYDIIGKEVASLANNEFKRAGTHFINWDASKFASGVYFYKFEAGENRFVKRMVLIK